MEMTGSEEDVAIVLGRAAGVGGGFGSLEGSPGVGLPRRCPPPEKG